MIITAILVVVAAGAVVAITLRSDKPVADDEAVEASSILTFDGSKARGWMQGVTNRVSMAVFGSGDAQECFISAEYKTGAVDVAGALAATYEGNAQARYASKVVESRALYLNVDGESVAYELHQIDAVRQPGADPLMAGRAVGYVQLAGVYVKLLSLCGYPEQRVST